MQGLGCRGMSSVLARRLARAACSQASPSLGLGVDAAAKAAEKAEACFAATAAGDYQRRSAASVVSTSTPSASTSAGFSRSFASGPSGEDDEETREAQIARKSIDLARRQLEEDLGSLAETDDDEKELSTAEEEEGEKEEVALQMPGSKWIELSDLPKAAFPL